MSESTLEQPVEQVTDAAPDADLDAQLSAIWAKNTAEGDAPAQPAAEPVTEGDQAQPRGADGKFVAKDGEGTPKPPEAKPAAEDTPATDDKQAQDDKAEDDKQAAEDKKDAPKSEAPSNLPRAVRDNWDKMPPDVQEAIAASQTEMASKLSDATRQIQGIGPIFDVVKRAAAEIPQLKDMQPGQIAGEVFELAKWSAALERDPVGALMTMAERHGAGEALKARLGGEQPSEIAQLHQQIATLQQQVARQQDPVNVAQMVDQRMQMQNSDAAVQQFALSKPDWDAVEPHMPHFVQIVRTSKPDATHAQVLEEAYQEARYAVPAIRQQLQSAAEAQRIADEKAQAAQAAASLNVRPNGSGQATPMTEDQELSQIYRRNHG